MPALLECGASRGGHALVPALEDVSHREQLAQMPTVLAPDQDPWMRCQEPLHKRRPAALPGAEDEDGSVVAHSAGPSSASIFAIRRATAVCGSSVAPSITRSGFSGRSYGSSMPVKPRSSPARAFA